MHEMAISCNIVETVSEAAIGRQVSVVTIEVGKLSCVAVGVLAFCFDVAAKGTVLEKTRLHITEIDGWARCSHRAADFAAPSVLIDCACGSHNVRWLRGQELNIKSLELAAETLSCAKPGYFPR